MTSILERATAKYFEQNPDRVGRETPFTDTELALMAALDEKKGRVADLARAGLDRIFKR